VKARSLLSLPLLLSLPAALFVACVGDDPTPADPAADASTAPTTTVAPGPDGATPGDGATPNDGATSSDGATPSDGATSSDGATPVDAADAAKPPPTCRVPASTGGFYTRCRAAAGAVTPGGNVQGGAYVLQGAQGLNYCTATFVFGTGEVFTENGETYLRYNVLRAATTGDNPVPYTGTLWLTYSPATGALRTEEMCDATRKGQSRTGTIEVVANDMTLTFPNGQEVWKRQ